MLPVKRDRESVSVCVCVCAARVLVVVVDRLRTVTSPSYTFCCPNDVPPGWSSTGLAGCPRCVHHAEWTLRVVYISVELSSGDVTCWSLAGVEMVKTFQAYLPSECHRTYSCVHCRAHLANHDELISKVGLSVCLHSYELGLC